MSRRDYQWPRPGHGYDRRAAAAAQWYGAASTSFPNPGAAPMHGINPYAFAPNPLFAANPFNNLVGDLLLQNPAALASYHQQQQLQQAHHFPSPPYHQTPTSNIQHRPTKPAASASPAPAPPQPQQQQQQPRQQAALDRAQVAARNAREELVKNGEGVTGWKVVQAVLVALKVDSWDSLGIQLQDVPLLRDLLLIEGKVSAQYL